MWNGRGTWVDGECAVHSCPVQSVRIVLARGAYIRIYGAVGLIRILESENATTTLAPGGGIHRKNDKYIQIDLAELWPRYTAAAGVPTAMERGEHPRRF